MRILITNDDGILAPALPHLVEWAKKLGEVMVVAPKVEQSGKSHAIDFTRPIEIKKVDLFGDVVAYSMDSTPADCVRFAVLGLKEKFDLVLSGINRGFNSIPKAFIFDNAASTHPSASSLRESFL